ncbi:MAG: hypothetical protein M4D80_40700 [Myxococcota bacterium]|nr:hypothetical protein [Myxococcota bacterium]
MLAACGGSSAPPSTRIGPAVIAAIEAAPLAPWRCASPSGPNLVEETLGAWTLAGHTMKRGDAGAITIGVIADAGGAAPQTLAALGRLRAKLADVDLVIALGGMGGSRADLEATLGVLGDDKRPLVVLPGDLEPVTDLVAAIAALRARGQHVIDGRLAQRIELPGISIATIAGAIDASRLVAGADGCAFRADDIAAAFADLTAQKGIRILASAEAPRVTMQGEPAGELALVPGATQEIDIALHGPVEVAASPARTGGRDGAAVPLTPGTSDATTRLPGPRKSTSAGLLTISGSAWKWRPIADTD